MKLYLIIAAVVALLLSYAGTFYLGSDYGESKQLARAASTQEIVDDAIKARDGQFAEAVNGIEGKRQIITQKVTHEIKNNTVYADCKHTDGMLSTINEALTGRPDTPPADSVPKTAAPSKPGFWGDNLKIRRLGAPVPQVP